MATGKGRRVARDGGVTSTRGLKERSHCKRNMFPIIVYAFTAHNHRVTHRRVRNGRPRQAARSVAVPSPAAASTGLSVPESPYDVELPRSTLVARPAVHRNHLAPPSRHRGPNSAQTPPASHPGSARPRSCCRYVGNHSRREHCLHQSTNITFPRRLTAPRSMAGGSLVDPRPSRPSSSMGRRPSDGSWSLAMADAWRCPAPAGTASGSIRSGHIRARDRTRAARPSGGWARRLPAARGTARKA